MLPVHIGVGTGYGFDGDGWKHGAYQGDLEVQGKVYDLSTDEGRGAMFGIVDSVAKFTSDGQTGWGLFEHLYLWQRGLRRVAPPHGDVVAAPGRLRTGTGRR